MSDFLTNLTARSLGSASNLLKPQLPLLFEPAQGAASMLEGEGRLNEQADVPTPDAAPDRLTRDNVRTHRDLRPAAPVVDVGGAEARTHPAVPQTIVPPGAPPRMDMPDRQQPTEPVRAEETVRAVKVPSGPAQVTGLRADYAAGLVERTDRAQGSRTIGARLVPILPKPGSIRSADQNGREREPIPADQGSAAIHISIGRIEVRAVTQPSAPPLRAAAPNRPTLTLDEYLLHRNEIKR